MSRIVWAAVATLTCVACRDRGPAETNATASMSAAPAASSAAAEPAPWYVGAWSGTFEVERHAIDLDPKQGAPKAWSDAAAKVGTGSGTLEVTVDEAGVVTAKATGALGALSGSGEVQDERVALRLTPGTGEGFAGTLLTEHKDGALVGVLRASSPDSLAVRRAVVKLVKK